MQNWKTSALAVALLVWFFALPGGAAAGPGLQRQAPGLGLEAGAEILKARQHEPLQPAARLPMMRPN